MTYASATEFPSVLSSEHRQLRHIEWLVGSFGFFLVLLSMTLSFMNTTSKEVSGLISDQNDAASRLGSSAHYYQASPPALPIPPPGLEHSLIEFSRQNASLIYTADRLSIIKSIWRFFVPESLLDRIKQLHTTDDSKNVIFDHLTVNPEQTTVDQIAKEVFYQIRLYQAIRDHAQDLCGKWQGAIAAVTTYMLPVFYALLGAFLYMFRFWPESRGARYQSPDRASRFLMAGIAGIAIGALHDLFPNEVMFSPLVIAFVVGYSIEVLTSRLDALIHELSKKPNSCVTGSAQYPSDHAQ
jgi:hypothetical protein